MIFPDSDVLVDVMRGLPAALTWLASIGDEEIVLCGYVAMELIQGARNRAEQRRIERWLASWSVAWPDETVCAHALTMFAKVHLGRSIGLLDALIAQHAVSLGTDLVTFNRKHYDGVPGLATNQPYSR